MGWKKDLPDDNYSSMIGSRVCAKRHGHVTLTASRGLPPVIPRRKKKDLNFLDFVFSSLLSIASHDRLVDSSCSPRRLRNSRCDGVRSLTSPPVGMITTNPFPLPVAVQQPSAMRLSMAKFASPAAVATGNYMQMRSVRE